jgi:hypothetical protein
MRRAGRASANQMQTAVMASQTHSRLLRQDAWSRVRRTGIGNQAMQRLFIQPKLTVNHPGDQFEQEADRVATEVMRTPESPAIHKPPHIQRMCSACEDDLDDSKLQMKSAPGASLSAGPFVEHELERLQGGGSALSESTRNFFEPRLGQDLSDVRVHTDGRAAASARSLNAKAFTTGRDIVFGAGEFAPETDEGRTLLAHELVHTIQQAGTGEAPATEIQRTIGDGHDLSAPRFSGNVVLERAFDNETLISVTSHRTGAHVRLIQESLLAQGYTLPEFGVDGIFGPETKAAVMRFQTDVGAVLIDGIVGPETMGLFDQHDTSLLTGVGPVPITGPVPGPRPGPGCNAPYTGVTFTLANQVASGANPAARIGMGRRGGRDALIMQGTVPATYTPDITINAPSDAKAREFQVGFISNILTDFNEYTFSTGDKVHAVLPTPMKDGLELASGQYDPVYVTQPSPAILETFTGNAATVHLVWPDTPSDEAFVNLLDNPQCAGLATPGTMTSAHMKDTFRTWVAVRHMASGCVLPLHHIDWDLDWSALVFRLPLIGFVSLATGSAINVTVPDGDGKVPFIQGGQVPNDFVTANTDRVCP